MQKKRSTSWLLLVSVIGITHVTAFTQTECYDAACSQGCQTADFEQYACYATVENESAVSWCGSGVLNQNIYPLSTNCSGFSYPNSVPLDTCLQSDNSMYVSYACSTYDKQQKAKKEHEHVAATKRVRLASHLLLRPTAAAAASEHDTLEACVGVSTAVLSAFEIQVTGHRHAAALNDARCTGSLEVRRVAGKIGSLTIGSRHPKQLQHDEHSACTLMFQGTVSECMVVLV